MTDVRQPLRLGTARIGHSEPITAWVFYELDYVRRGAQSHGDGAAAHFVHMVSPNSSRATCCRPR